jgi:hypothetical protein
MASELYVPNESLVFLPQEQKSHIRQAMMDLLVSQNNVIRSLAVDIVPKIAQADWPSDWPGFLEQLSAALNGRSNANQVISVLKVLKGTT